MSESEKRLRDLYQAKRRQYIFLQRIALIALTALLLISTFVYIRLDKNTYVYYTEEGNAIHKAYLNQNDYYEQGYLNGSHAYVASLVEQMTADFSYDLTFDTDEVTFKYNYRIDAQLEILDKKSSAPLYNPTYEIFPLTSDTKTGNRLSIDERVYIDYHKYNEIAENYLAEYHLKDTTNTLIVRMYVNVVGESQSFAEDRSGEHVTELRIPLTQTTFKPEVTTTVPAGEQKILAINENVRGVFGVLTVVFLVLDVLGVAFYAFFVAATRDKHIDYRRRVDRILKNYKSYIQQTTSRFESEGYRLFRLNHISELLDIRDTIQKPILTYENEDKTCSQFFIVADLNLAYLYEIEVEDEEDVVADEPAIEPVVEEDPVVELQPEIEPEPDPEPDVEPVVEPEPVLEGVEVIRVKFPENDVEYKFDPNGEKLEKGDIVLVPTMDICRGKEVEREAEVAVGNHRVPADSLKFKLKKIIRVVRRAIQNSL